MQDDFEDLIKRLKQRPAPPCPVQLDANVLHRVRPERSPESLPWLPWLLGLLRQPAYAAAALALGITVSTTVSLVSASENHDRQAELSQAFGFDSITQPHLIHLDGPQQP